MLDLLNEAWTAWNQQLGATIATIMAAIALITSQGQRMLRLASSVVHWRGWRAITNQYKKTQGWHRIRRAKTIMRAELTRRTAFTIPIRTYANCLAESRRMATRGELEKITPEKPKWLNDYYVARALALQRRFLSLVNLWAGIASRKARPQTCQACEQVAMERCSGSLSYEPSL